MMKHFFCGILFCFSSTYAMEMVRVVKETVFKPSFDQRYCDAIESGDGMRALMLIEKRVHKKNGIAKINNYLRPNNMVTPLHKAVFCQQSAVVEKLINDYHVDVNKKTGDGNSVLHAVQNMKMCAQLIEAGAYINEKNATGATPLLYALQRQKEVIIGPLLAAGADVNAPDNSGISPLRCAIENRLPTCIIKLLLRYNALLTEEIIQLIKEEKNPYLFIIIKKHRIRLFDEKIRDIVCRNNVSDIKNFINQYKIDINSHIGTYGMPLLCLAVRLNQEKIVHWLLDRPDLNINAQTKDGSTALAFVKTVEMGEKFLQKGADFTIKNNDGLSVFALIMFFAPNAYDIVKMMLQRGADPNTKIKGAPLLLGVIRSQYPERISLLLEHGVEVPDDIMKAIEKSPFVSPDIISRLQKYHAEQKNAVNSAVPLTLKCEDPESAVSSSASSKTSSVHSVYEPDDIVETQQMQ